MELRITYNIVCHTCLKGALVLRAEGCNWPTSSEVSTRQQRQQGIHKPVAKVVAFHITEQGPSSRPAIQPGNRRMRTFF
eukprot:5638058-Heterocapsa_arctica.AAC.1